MGGQADRQRGSGAAGQRGSNNAVILSEAKDLPKTCAVP